jgi:hypothetical protein
VSALQIELFMQNKAKFQKVKSNVNKVLTMDYGQMDTWSIKKKQSQFKPNTKPIRTQYKAKQSQFVVSLPPLTAAQGTNLFQSSTMLNCAIFTAVVLVHLAAAIIFCLIWRFGLDHRLKIAYFTHFIFPGHLRLRYLCEGIS